MAILEKEVAIVLKSKDIKYYKEKGYEIPKKKNKWGHITVIKGTSIVVKIEDLLKGSNVLLTRICDECGKKDKDIPYYSLSRQRANGDGKDRCFQCGKKYAGNNRKSNLTYENSAEHFCLNNGLEHLINEFSDKNSKKMNEISYGSGDIFKWKCFVCYSEYEMSMSNRVCGRKSSCPYCTGQKTNHTNCLWTTHPHIAKLLLDPEVGYNFTAGSDVRVDFKCCNCGNQIKNKKINNIVNFGLSCPKCSDGISYCEKFFFSLLTQLKIDFEVQKSFKWSNRKRYDFYLSAQSCIIETHGNQHYSKGFVNLGGRTVWEEQENDKLKEELARGNGIQKYIVIDCSKADCEYLIDNIHNSEMSNLFNLNNIDWLKCHSHACNSIVNVVCEYWNNGLKNVTAISKILKMNNNTIARYLKTGSLLQWCDYDPKEQHEKLKNPVIKLSLTGEYLEEFNSVREATRKTGVDISSIGNVCKGKQKTAGGYKWVYVKDNIKEENNDEI